MRARRTCASAPDCRGRPRTGWPPGWRCTGCWPATPTAAGGSGPRLTELAGQVNDPLLAAGAAVLPRLREITGESVQLYRREGTSRICVAALEPPAGLRDTVPVGTRLPMTAGSGAKVLLAYSDPATQQAVLPTRQVHRPHAGRGAQARLGAECRRARARGGECVGAGARRARRR